MPHPGSRVNVLMSTHWLRLCHHGEDAAVVSSLPRHMTRRRNPHDTVQDPSRTGQTAIVLSLDASLTDSRRNSNYGTDYCLKDRSPSCACGAQKEPGPSHFDALDHHLLPTTIQNQLLLPTGAAHDCLQLSGAFLPHHTSSSVCSPTPHRPSPPLFVLNTGCVLLQVCARQSCVSTLRLTCDLE